MPDRAGEFLQAGQAYGDRGASDLNPYSLIEYVMVVTTRSFLI